MKILAIIGILMGSVSAFACPNIEGDYLCTSGAWGNSLEVKIKQIEVDGITTYVVARSRQVNSYIADGISRYANLKFLHEPGERTSQCVGYALQVTEHFKDASNGNEIEYFSEYVKRASDLLTIATKDTVSQNDSYTDYYSCKPF